MSKSFRRSRWLWLLLPALLAAAYVTIQLLQTAGIHDDCQFIPEYAMEDLSDTLEKDVLSSEDYDRIFLQTGLARPAVEELLTGENGREQILRTQSGFFDAPEAQCVPLLPARFTCEDRMFSESGRRLAAVPLAPLQPGDILLTFATHSVGWRHGHGGLVVETDPAVTLEATVLGSDSALVDSQNWRTYANFMVLRVKDADDETRQQVVDNALAAMEGVPYSLLAGLGREKAPPLDAEHHSAQCAYLPWYAWQSCGVDLDSDGGRIVTIKDLADSPKLEIVQVFGIDPRLLLEANRANLS